MDDTLVVFTSDQGEPLGEHGYRPPVPPLALRGADPHAADRPDARAASTAAIRHQALVQTVDLLPTILSALGLPPIERVHGHDLLPLIRGEQTKVRDYACLGMDVEEFAIRTHLWHLIVPVEPDPDDPPRPRSSTASPRTAGTRTTSSSQHPEVAEHLELTLRRFVEAVGRDALDDLPPLRDVARFAPS